MGRMQYAPTRTDENRAGFWFVFIRRIKNRIGIGFIRPLPWPFVGRMLLRPTRVPEKMAIFLSVRPPAWPFVGRMQYAPTLPGKNSSGFWFVFIRGIKNQIGIRFIRPLTWPFVGRMQYAPYTVDIKNGNFSIHSTSGVAVCGAYAIRPYTGDLKNGDFSIRSASGVAVCGAYAIRPYPAGKKIHRGFGSFLSGKSKIGSELDSSDHRRGRLWGVCNTPLHNRPEKWRFFYPFGLWLGRLWGVCNTPLPYRAKIHRGFGLFLYGESKI